MNYLKKTWFLFSKKNKIKAVCLYFLIIFNVLLEILSIGSIVPILIFFLEDNIFEKYKIISEIFIFLNLQFSKESFFILILLSISLIFVVKTATITLQVYLESNLSWQVHHEIRQKLFKTYILNDISFHNDKHSSTIINNLTKETSFLFHAVSNLINLFSQGTLSILICLTLFLYKPFEFFFIFSLILIILVFYNLLTSKSLKTSSNLRQNYEENLLKKILNGLGGIREIKVFNLERKFLETFDAVAIKLLGISKKLQILVSLPRIILELMIVLAILLILYFFVDVNLDANLILTTAGVFTVASIKLLPSLSKIYQSIQSLKINAPSVKVIYSDITKYSNESLLPKKKISSNFKFNDSLEINNLNFSYNSSNSIFKDVNLKINKLDLIGIKGESGLGKSTLIDLILGLKKPQSGEIIVDNKNINLDINSWQNKISYVPQEIFVMDDTIKNNIAFDFDNQSIDMKKFYDVCKASEIYDVFSKLPEKFDTSIGERGSRISIGQKQRIGLARALYKKPDLLLLDEFTSSLDKETKNKILNTIIKINNNTTIIIVSHDEDVLKKCGRVIEVKNKKIIEINIS
jgi:ATP-binding cassette, subfamily B, bacterial PglK